MRRRWKDFALVIALSATWVGLGYAQTYFQTTGRMVIENEPATGTAVVTIDGQRITVAHIGTGLLVAVDETAGLGDYRTCMVGTEDSPGSDLFCRTPYVAAMRQTAEDALYEFALQAAMQNPSLAESMGVWLEEAPADPAPDPGGTP